MVQDVKDLIVAGRKIASSCALKDIEWYVFCRKKDLSVASGQTTTASEMPVINNLTQAGAIPTTDKLAIAICEMPIDEMNAMEGEMPFENALGDETPWINSTTAVGGITQFQLLCLCLGKKK